MGDTVTMNPIKRTCLHYHYSSWWFKTAVVLFSGSLGFVLGNFNTFSAICCLFCLIVAEIMWQLDRDRPFNLVLAHEYSSNHRKLIARSKLCGCFYCERIFAPSEITEWTDCGETAICKCGIDSVLPNLYGMTTPDFLHKMHKRWFTGGIAYRTIDGKPVICATIKPDVDDWGNEQ